MLNPNSQGIEYTKEIFRSLILAQRSPTMFELALMADLPAEERNDELALRRCVARCGAFITITEDDNQSVEWIDVAAKEHLEAYARDQLSLDLSDVQHGIIALRCLQYVSSNHAMLSEQQGDAESTQGEEGSEHELSEQEDSKSEEDRSDPEALVNIISSQNEELPKQDSQDQTNFETQDTAQQVPKHTELKPSQGNQQAEATIDGDNTSTLGTPQNTEIFLSYPGQYWLEHAKQAPIDVTEEFDLSGEFWSEESSLRAAWWKQYAEDNGYDDLSDTTPLHIAAISGYSALLDYLLENECTAEIQKIDSWGFTPFYWACRTGDIYLVQQLLKAGADVNTPRHDGKITALWVAASWGHAEIVQYLLEHGAVVDIQDKDLGTPLYVAAENGCTPVVHQLLQAQANVNLVGGLHRHALNAAAYSGHAEIVQLLLEHGVEIEPADEYRYGSALGAAARKGHVDIVRLLIQKGWSVNRKFKTYYSVLVVAATYGHAEVVQALLENEIDITSREQALEIASKNGKTEVVRKLLEQSSYLRHQKAFLNAASYGRDDVLDLLEKRGTNQEMLNMALYDASDQEHESTVKLLVKYGADPNSEGKE